MSSCVSQKFLRNIKAYRSLEADLERVLAFLGMSAELAPFLIVDVSGVKFEVEI
jgi:hypothetical protein